MFLAGAVTFLASAGTVTFLAGTGAVAFSGVGAGAVTFTVEMASGPTLFLASETFSVDFVIFAAFANDCFYFSNFCAFNARLIYLCFSTCNF